MFSLQQQFEKYWNNIHERYACIDVWLKDTYILANSTVQTFHVQHEDAEGVRVSLVVKILQLRHCRALLVLSFSNLFK